jgi:hypothetical protein
LADDYNHALSPSKQRDASSLKTKFKQFVNVKKPTGSGEIPFSVRKAKSINRLIDTKVGIQVISSGE